MRLTDHQRRRKLRILARLYNYPHIPWMLAATLRATIVPGICAHRGDLSCTYHRMVRYDVCVGWCPECRRFSVQSCWYLTGIFDL